MTVASDRLLRRTLWGNAVFSIVSGAGLALVVADLAVLEYLGLRRFGAAA